MGNWVWESDDLVEPPGEPISDRLSMRLGDSLRRYGFTNDKTSFAAIASLPVPCMMLPMLARQAFYMLKLTDSGVG